MDHRTLTVRLHIRPRAVNSSSEVLTGDARAMATRAWQTRPFNVYAATETGGIAAECAQHRGLHLFEDLVIPEVVDDGYQPVPAGQPGDRLLVTVLPSHALDLLDATGWQVRQDEQDLPVLIAAAGPRFDPTVTADAVRAALTTAGARSPAVTIRQVDTIPAGAAGKRPLVVARKARTVPVT